MSPIGVILISLIIGTSGLVIASVWLLIRPDRKTCILSTAAAGFITAFLVSFVDVSAPVISQRENTFSYTAELWIRDICQVYDMSDSNPLLFLEDGSPNTFRYNKKDKTIRFSAPGKYMLSFRATDKNGNSGTKTFAVHIVDDIPPVLNLSHETITLDLSSPAPGRAEGEEDRIVRDDEGMIRDYSAELLAIVTGRATAMDEIDGDVTDAIRIEDSTVRYDIPGEYPATVIACDTSQNETSTVIRVIIKRQSQPAPAPENRTSAETVAGRNSVAAGSSSVSSP